VGADRPCAAWVTGREACRRIAWRESPYCWYHLPRCMGEHLVANLRWCSWRGNQCQRWALEDSSLCLAHDPGGSPLWRRVQWTARIEARWDNEALRNQYDEAAQLEADLLELARVSALSVEESRAVEWLLAASRAVRPYLAIAVPISPLEDEQYELEAEKRRVHRDYEHWARHRQFRAARLEWDTAVRNLRAIGLPEDPGLHDLILKWEALNKILRL
jgi:hypothetical protein